MEKTKFAVEAFHSLRPFKKKNALGAAAASAKAGTRRDRGKRLIHKPRFSPAARSLGGRQKEALVCRPATPLPVVSRGTHGGTTNRLVIIEE